MVIMQRFLAYAGDFEKTLKDDDWTRLEPYFADDAVYEVAAGFGGRMSGPAAIFAGMKKSLDHFDRKFAARDIDVTSGPEIVGDEMRLGWKVTYHQTGLPDYVLLGHSVVRYAGGRIVYLTDIYEPGQDAYLAEYQRANGVALDPSYT
jgi:hypothetical protein